MDNLRKECSNIEVHNVDIADWDKTGDDVASIGPIDMLVNNAAIGNACSFLDVIKQELDNHFDINIKAVYNGMVARNKGGSIVNIMSYAINRTVLDFAV